MPTSMIKGQSAGNTPNALILVNRPTGQTDLEFGKRPVYEYLWSAGNKAWLYHKQDQDHSPSISVASTSYHVSHI